MALARTAYALHDEAVIVEIGTFLGRSAVLLAGARRLKGSGIVHCVDPFDASGDAFSVPKYRAIQSSEGAGLRERFDRNIARAGLNDWVAVHEGQASQVAATWTGGIDMVFLDGDQSPRGARSAYENWVPFLTPGGVIAVHNSHPADRDESHSGMARLVEEEIHPPAYADVRVIGTTTFARKY